MIQNPVELPARNFETAVNGISSLISALLAETTENLGDDSLVIDINSNTILTIFGEWLFDSATISTPGYEQGRANSLSILCNLFSKLQPSEKILTVYVERFYWALKAGLGSDFLSAKSILVNSHKLFIIGQEGFRMLIPFYLQALYNFLPTYRDVQDPLCQKEDFERLRRSCYTLIGDIAYTLNRIGKIPLICPFAGLLFPAFKTDGIDEWVI